MVVQHYNRLFFILFLVTTMLSLAFPVHAKRALQDLGKGQALSSLSEIESGPIIRAKIGIQISSGNRLTLAKTRDKLNINDLLRIYIIPEVDSYIYVIHTDYRIVTLLNTLQKTTQGSVLILPAPQGFYRIDGSSPLETFTILCSPTELPEVLELFQGKNLVYEQWAPLEKRFIDQSKIELTQPSDKPFGIAGNVRGTPVYDPFLDTLPIFSGVSLVVKRYEFTIQK